ncbi:terpene synthase 10-like [Neltuma alba]|uniref:terpene synthase 10-like n=1 Tax=Neltuma alba TaxID=207710 RepID=UPI0010A4EE83|nr:terpene synthase 10-like [Prosopis alba]
MALYQFPLLSNAIIFKTKMLQSKPMPSLPTVKTSGVPRPIQCKALATIVSNRKDSSRGSANHFQPSIWDYDYIQSIRSDFVEESHLEERDRLKGEVRVMLLTLTNPVEQLELIDDLQRLGVAYHFSQEIRKIMEKIYNNDTFKVNNNLHAMALEFRLLRQQGHYDVSSETFDGFLDKNSNFHSRLSSDIKGLLSLYEASFHSMEGDIVLDKAREFSSTHLKEFLNKSNEDDEISLLVSHALEFPLHWRILRLDTRWFIDIYEGRPSMSPALLDLARLDFNIVQAIHQDDMKNVSRWWKRTGLGEKLSFARDRMVENFIWTVGLAFEPHLGNFRRAMSKANALITTIDDIYDVHGTLEDLTLFTEVVNRWDINSMDELPDYMKICFLALYNFVNEVAFDFLKENGCNIIPHLKKMWADLCKSYLVEAKWYYRDYKPSFHEYLENAWISISVPVALFHAYFSLPNSTNKEDLIWLDEYSNVIRCSSTIFRLVNDLGTAKREKVTGDIPKSVECYMNETGASEADTHKHINSLICETWKKLNEEVSNSSYNSRSFVQVAVNLVRMCLRMYQHGDGHTVQDDETKNRIISLLFKPIV